MMPEFEFSFRCEGVPEEEAFVVRDAFPGECFDIFLKKYPLNAGECVIVKLEKIHSSEECLEELEKLIEED